MALTDEQLKEINAFYDLPNHGFLRGLPGVKDSVLSGWTQADYTELWGSPFKDYLEQIQSEGFDIKNASNLDDIFRAVLDFSPPYKMHDIVLEKLSDKTFGDLLSHKDEITEGLKREEQEINADYTENYGQKKDNFLKAVRYTPDGHEIDFFFRYWRRPLMKLMTDRGVDLSSTEGEAEVKGILKDLFGSEYTNYDIMTLLQETPEHLIEQKKEIEARRKEFLKNEELEKEMLFDKPFFETLEKFIGIRFSDKTDINQMAAEAYARSDAHDKLKEFLKTKENLDEAVFAEVLGETPRNIVHQSDRLSAELTCRQDNDYLMTHPTATFGEFLKTRRDNIIEGTLEGERIKQEALSLIIQSPTVDNKAVKDAIDVPWEELYQNREDIIAKIKSRKIRKAAAITAVFSGLVLLTTWIGTKAFKSNHQPEQKTAPIVQRETQKQTQEVKEQKQETKKKPQETVKQEVKNPETKKKVASETQNAEKQKKTLTQSETKRGHRPILGNWQTWTDKQCTQKISGMFQQLFMGEFEFLKETSQKTKKPLYQVLDIDTLGQDVVNENGFIQTKPNGANISSAFYVKTWGNDLQNLKNDLVSYHKNIKDVLNDLPGTKDNLAEKQLLAMDAIGPSMGWSIKQQQIAQRANVQQQIDSQAFITETAKEILNQQQADQKDMDAVFGAVMHATKLYRQAHPDCNFLLLSADHALRKITGLEKTASKQVEMPAPKNENQQTANIVPKATETPKPAKEEKESSYPWLWIIGTAALTCYLGSEYWKGKAEIVK